jgi:hypothetical protein
LDWEDIVAGKDKEKSKKFVYKQLNKYTPIKWISFTELKALNHYEIWDKIFRNFFEFKLALSSYKDNRSRKKAIKKLQFKDIVPLSIQSDENYLLENGSIRTSRQILWYLHWDIWELILFLLVEWFLKSPVFFSKIRHCKSSSWDKVKWSDWIHIELSDEWDIVYNFLESKINKDFDSSLSQVIESNNEFISNLWEWGLNSEVTILYNNHTVIDNRFIDLLWDNYESIIAPYLDDKTKQIELKYNIVSLIWYNCDLYKRFLEKEPDLEFLYINTTSIKRIKNVLKEYKLIENKLNWKKVTIFLLPLIDEVKLIKTFLHEIEITDE